MEEPRRFAVVTRDALDGILIHEPNVDAARRVLGVLQHLFQVEYSLPPHGHENRMHGASVGHEEALDKLVDAGFHERAPIRVTVIEAAVFEAKFDHADLRPDPQLSECRREWLLRVYCSAAFFIF